MIRIFITGINGLVGGILRNGLSDAYEIFGLDRNNDPPVRNVVTADVSDYGQTLAALRARLPIACVVHLAAAPSIEADWDSVLRNNIVGTRNVYEAAAQLGIGKIVFASSLHAAADIEKLAERRADADETWPASDYGVSKAFGELLARSYLERHGIRSVCTRIGRLKPDFEQPPEHYRRIWFRHTDMVQMFRRAIESGQRYAVYHGVSAPAWEL